MALTFKAGVDQDGTKLLYLIDCVDSEIFRSILKKC